MSNATSKKSRFLVIGLAAATAFALPLAASAHDHWRGGHGYRGGGYYSGGYGRGYQHDYDRGYDRGYRGSYYRGYHGGYWRGGRWIAGALVTGAVAGLVVDALRPAPIIYPPPVVYTRPARVIYEQAGVVYEDAPPVTTRVITTRTVPYSDPYNTRYIRDDGYGN